MALTAYINNIAVQIWDKEALIMEARPISIYIVTPMAQETIDATNGRIRRVLQCNVFYREDKVDPEVLADLLIGMESTFAFPGEEEHHIWRNDDMRWIGQHRARIHLSRPLLME